MNTVQDDRLIFLTKAAFGPLAVFTAIFGPLLFLFPGSTATYWAWEIRPEMSAAWVGAGYTFGALAIWTILIMNRWHKLFVPIVATWTLSTVMLIATIMHWDRFFINRIQFWIWFIIYIFLPVGLPLIWVLNSRRSIPAQANEMLLPQPLVMGFAAGGIAGVVLGLILLFSPATAASFWPWELTPLMSRVISGWVLFIGVGALCTLLERRYKVYREFILAATVWFFLLLVAGIWHRSDFDFTRASSYIFFSLFAAVVPFMLFLFITFERRYKSAQQ